MDLLGGKSREEAELGLFGILIFADLGWAGLGLLAGGRRLARAIALPLAVGDWVRLVSPFGGFGWVGFFGAEAVAEQDAG